MSTLVFDASGGIREDELAFKDFGTSSIPADISSSSTTTGRISPNPSSDATARLYSPDLAMHEQMGGNNNSNNTNGARGWFNLDSYSGWFDVDTATVLERSYRTLYPKEDYLSIVLNNTPDLYGPFWVPTTLIFSLFLSSSLSSSIHAYLSGRSYAYDFTALSLAVSLIYTYSLLVPIGLWAVMRYWAKCDDSNAGPVEIVSIYGYATTAWIFAALLSIPPIPYLRFAWAVLAAILSGFFILRNIYPILSTAQSKAAQTLIPVIAILHLSFSLILWFYFLNTSDAGTPILPGSGSDSDSGAGTGGGVVTPTPNPGTGAGAGAGTQA